MVFVQFPKDQQGWGVILPLHTQNRVNSYIQPGSLEVLTILNFRHATNKILTGVTVNKYSRVKSTSQ